MRELLAEKQPINWQNWDPNVDLWDLDQLTESQQEMPRKLSGTGQTETTKTLGILNKIQTGKGTHKRTLCQKNQGTVRFKQKPVTVGDRTTYRTLSPKRTSFRMGFAKGA
jgi:hypothetical protein